MRRALVATRVDALALALVVTAGFAAGVTSGLFGVGGGVLMVPAALYLVPGTVFHEAKAISLLVIVLSAGIGIYTHARARSVDFARGAILAASGIAGAALSAILVEDAADRTLRLIFGAFLAITGAYLALRRTPRPHTETPRPNAPALLAIGLAAGLLSGALGVGGGIIMVPGMILSGVGVHLAVGTSLVAVLANALAATGVHLTLGYGPTLATLGVPLALGAIPGTHVGSRLAHNLHGERLQWLFGIFLALVGAWVALDAP